MDLQVSICLSVWSMITYILNKAAVSSSTMWKGPNSFIQLGTGLKPIIPRSGLQVCATLHHIRLAG